MVRPSLPQSILMYPLKSSTTVFPISCALAFLFLLWGAVAPHHLAAITGALQTSLLDSFGWLYVLAATGFLVCALCLIFSRWGDIPLGPDGAKPDFPL
ncbi:MAG: BCCT family transporter, partial [Nitrospirota bacterium]|nr:BCCT family transporter [Nitrospirota bacterium]